jgi:hypothetical protein
MHYLRRRKLYNRAQFTLLKIENAGYVVKHNCIESGSMENILRVEMGWFRLRDFCGF